ncbi:hypothetical protein [Cellvibrio sp. OA-2007]|uniref:hypothetical protein n=1 Tax=Cellvibrio sp. OA-2007 TaxID=529823 RepID=UPI0007851AB7|nr:hypothetical protein [Cellvibrio sp. OA-2007]
MVIKQKIKGAVASVAPKIVVGLLGSFICFLCFFVVTSKYSYADEIKPLMRVVISCEKHLTPDHDDYYFSKLLELVLAKTAETHGPYQINFVPVMPINNRLLREIELGRVDVTWMPHNANAPQQLLPIRFRLLKNLSDHRVFLIRTGDQARFDPYREYRTP